MSIKMGESNKYGHKPVGYFGSYDEYSEQFRYARDECGNILYCSVCGKKIEALSHAIDDDGAHLHTSCYKEKTV
ncbi:MAG: hypothetical protein ACTSPI_00855 [Candidatus Heimdallarchaeaceae archaeon]